MLPSELQGKGTRQAQATKLFRALIFFIFLIFFHFFLFFSPLRFYKFFRFSDQCTKRRQMPPFKKVPKTEVLAKEQLARRKPPVGLPKKRRMLGARLTKKARPWLRPRLPLWLSPSS
jgi:hypothetical protein